MKLRALLPGVSVLLFAVGCHQHPLTDYRPLDQAGMWSSGLEELKKLNTSDSEVAQLVKVKQARLSDDGCVALVATAHERKHPFTSGDSTANLASAGYSEKQILEIAQADQLDAISGDAVALRLIGLSDGFVQFILQRRLQGKGTLGTPQIARLKNTGLTEKKILEQIKAGLTDAQADREIAARESARNGAGAGFVRVRGRRPH
jgi:hypothetical protein